MKYSPKLPVKMIFDLFIVFSLKELLSMTFIAAVIATIHLTVGLFASVTAFRQLLNSPKSFRLLYAGGCGHPVVCTS